MPSNTLAKIQLESLSEIARDSRIEKQNAESSFPVDFKVVRPPHVLLTARLHCH